MWKIVTFECWIDLRVHKFCPVYISFSRWYDILQRIPSVILTLIISLYPQFVYLHLSRQINPVALLLLIIPYFYDR